MYEQKITGDIHRDIDVVYDAVNYTKAMVDRLVEEWQSSPDGEINAEYVEILNLQEDMRKASDEIYKIRNWYEPDRFYGPAANM